MAETPPQTLVETIRALAEVFPGGSVTENDQGMEEFISNLRLIVDPNRPNPTTFLAKLQTAFSESIQSLYSPTFSHRQIVLSAVASLLRHIHRTELIRLWDIEGPELSQRRQRKYRTFWREGQGIKEEGEMWEGLQKLILTGIIKHLERDRPKKTPDKVLKDDPITLAVGKAMFHPLTDIVVGDENWRIAPEVKYEAYAVLSDSISKHSENKRHLRSLLTPLLPQIGAQIEESADRVVIDGIIETAFRLNLDLDNRKEWSMKMFPSAEEGSRNQYFQGQFMKLTAPVFFEAARDLLDEFAQDKLTRSQPTKIIYLSHNKTVFVAPDEDNWNFYLCRDSAFVLVEVGQSGGRADKKVVFDFDAVESVVLFREDDIITSTFSLSEPAVFDASILSPAEKKSNLVVVKFEAEGTQAKRWLETLKNRAERYPDMQPQGNIKPVKVKASEAGEIVSTKNAGSSTNLQVSAPTEEGRTSRARSKERGRLVAQGSKLVEGEPVNQSQIKAADIAELAGIRAGGNTTSEGSDAEALAGRLEEIIVADENRGIEDVEMEVVERTVNAEMLPGNRMAIETVERTTTVEVHKSANTSRRSSRRPSLEPAATTSDAITKTFKTPANTSASASASTSRTVLKPRISHVEAHLSPIQSQDPLPRSSDDQDQQQSNSQEREALVRKEQDRLSESSALSDVEISDGEGDDDEYRASKEDPIEDESSSNRPAGRAAKAKAVEKLTGRRRDSDSPPPAKRQRRKSNVITLDEDGDEESEEESIPQTLEILPVHPKVKTTYQKVSPARAAARKSGGRASKGREEEEDEIEEESDGEPKILSVIDESIEDSSKEKTSRPSVTKPKSKKRSRDSDETDENFWNEPGTTTAPSAKSKRAPKASAAAKKSVEKPATKSTRGQRKSGESEAPTSVPKKLVGGMKKKGETSVSVEVARSTRGKGKARAVRSPTPGELEDNEITHDDGHDPISFSPPPATTTKCTVVPESDSTARATRSTTRAQEHDDSNESLFGDFASNEKTQVVEKPPAKSFRSGARDSGIAETVDARKSVEATSKPIDERAEGDDIGKGGAAQRDEEEDVEMDDEAPEVPVVEVTRDKGKGKQRAISPSVPLEPAEEEEDAIQQALDVEMEDVEEDEPAEVPDPDESNRMRWDPQPPRQVRARHDTSSLESPRQQQAGSSRRPVTAATTTRVDEESDAVHATRLSQNPHVTRSATTPTASASRQVAHPTPPTVVKSTRRLSAARPVRTTPLTTRLEIPEIILSTSRRSSKSTDTSHQLPVPSKKTKKVSQAEKRKKKVVVQSTDDSSQVLPSTLEDDLPVGGDAVDADGDDFEMGLHEVVSIIAEKSRQRDELLQRTFNRHYVANNRRVKSIASKSSQKTAQLIADLQPIVETMKSSRQNFLDLLQDLEQKESEAQVETDKLRAVEKEMKKKRKSAV